MCDSLSLNLKPEAARRLGIRDTLGRARSYNGYLGQSYQPNSAQYFTGKGIIDVRFESEPFSWL